MTTAAFRERKLVHLTYPWSHNSLLYSSRTDSIHGDTHHSNCPIKVSVLIHLTRSQSDLVRRKLEVSSAPPEAGNPSPGRHVNRPMQSSPVPAGEGDFELLDWLLDTGDHDQFEK
jgi:hypothetical protein